MPLNYLAFLVIRVVHDRCGTFGSMLVVVAVTERLTGKSLCMAAMHTEFLYFSDLQHKDDIHGPATVSCAYFVAQFGTRFRKAMFLVPPLAPLDEQGNPGIQRQHLPFQEIVALGTL